MMLDLVRRTARNAYHLLLIAWAAGATVQGWTSLMVVVLILGLALLVLVLLLLQPSASVAVRRTVSSSSYRSKSRLAFLCSLRCRSAAPRYWCSLP